MTSGTDLLKMLLDDFLRQKWGDACALFLIILGVALVVHQSDETSRDVGKSLIAAGLLALRPRTVQPQHQSQNGKGDEEK